MPLEPRQDPERTEPADSFAKHDRVRHEDFGRGYVAEIKGDSCLVFFLEDGQQRLIKQSKLRACE